MSNKSDSSYNNETISIIKNDEEFKEKEVDIRILISSIQFSFRLN